MDKGAASQRGYKHGYLMLVPLQTTIATAHSLGWLAQERRTSSSYRPGRVPRHKGER